MKNVKEKIKEVKEEAPKAPPVANDFYKAMFAEMDMVVKGYDKGKVKRGQFIDTILMMRMLSNAEYALALVNAVTEDMTKKEQIVIDLKKQVNQFRQSLYGANVKLM